MIFKRLKNLWKISEGEIVGRNGEELLLFKKPKKKFATIVEPSIVDEFPVYNEIL